MRAVQHSLYLCLFVCTFVCCKKETKKTIKTAEITFSKEGRLSIFNATTDSIQAQFDIEIAESDYETQTGLMYRKRMEEHQGMLFIFSDLRQHYFHMKNTEFSLDIIFIDENLKIASFQKNAKPYSEDLLPSNVPVKYVLEINGGLSEKLDINVGDKVEFLKL